MRAQATPSGWEPAGGFPAPRRRVARGPARRRAGVFAALCVVVFLLATAGCDRGRIFGTGPEFRGAPSPVPFGAGPPVPAPGQQSGSGRRVLTGACPAAAHQFSCLMRWRIRAAQRYLARQPGRIGLVLHDRLTGATWRNAYAGTAFPAASTMKLAMVTDLLVRARTGRIRLSPGDWTLTYEVLHSSSDAAADRLWLAFESSRFLRRIARFGMTACSFSAGSPYWGYMYCTPDDLNHLMNYVLGRLARGDRSYLTDQLRHVARIQQWGVWGAGRRLRPGNKNGWEDDGGAWVTNTVGFAGPAGRYTLAIMDQQPAPSRFHLGANALTQASALLFQGGHVPQPTAEATP